MHLRKVLSRNLVNENLQIGALAVATAVVMSHFISLIAVIYLGLQVERGLTGFKTGTDSIKLSCEPDKSKANPCRWGFTDDPWGQKTRNWVLSTKRLDKHQWTRVIAHACEYFPPSKLKVLNMDDDQGEANPHCCIELDWCVFIPLLLFTC